jgi:threonine aldolase
MAMRLKGIFKEKGYQFLVDSPTNQQFVVIDNEQVERLSRHVEFSHFGQKDHHHTICRFVTSWATTDADIDALAQIV